VDADLILVGGGLANCLIALQLKKHRPDLRLLMLERDTALGGNHTWSFHGSDVNPAHLAELETLIEQSWTHYDVRFPDRYRTLQGSYHSIVSERLHELVTAQLGSAILCNADVTKVTSNAVELADGRRFQAPGVLDGRGDPGNDALWVCYQKFLGQIIDLKDPHELRGPLLMDATVEQREGFRFIYVLPFSRNRLLIEDTRYSETAQLRHDEMQDEISRYAHASGWEKKRVIRQEEGVLPVVLGGDIAEFWKDNPGVPRSGVRAALFNQTTGYSLPEAVSCAAYISAMPDLTSPTLYRWLRHRSERLWNRSRFLRLLNRMLFLAGEPEHRYRVLEHFYRLPLETVDRLYAGRPNTMDRIRILSGKPPVPIVAAIRAMFASRPASQL